MVKSGILKIGLDPNASGNLDQIVNFSRGLYFDNTTNQLKTSTESNPGIRPDHFDRIETRVIENSGLAGSSTSRKYGNRANKKNGFSKFLF